MHAHKVLVRRASISPNTVPSSSLQNAWLRALRNIFRPSTVFGKGQRFAYSDEFLHPHDVFCQGIHFVLYHRRVLRLATFLPAIVMFFPINYTQTSLYFILLLVIRYNWCRGSSNLRYFSWYHFTIVICHNFDVQNHNAEISLEKGMIPRKSEWLASLVFLQDQNF